MSTEAALIAIWRRENPESSCDKDAAQIESYVRDRRWRDLVTLFRYSACEAAAFEALELIAPHMNSDKLAVVLVDFYTGAKTSAISAEDGARLLKLFRAADLRATVPPDLPERVRIYRGVLALDEKQARRRISEGVSWTLSSDIARNFARGLPGYKPLVPLRGFIGSGLIERGRILAVFNDWRQESECVVDPADVAAIEVREVS